MKNKHNDFFEPTATEIFATWFARQEWLSFIFVMTCVILFAIGVVWVFTAIGEIDRSCVGDCKVLLVYHSCLEEQPNLGAEGCMLYTVHNRNK